MAIGWKNVDERFLGWLRTNYEKRIPVTEYGESGYKPFFGNLFTVGDLVYVTQISSPKTRHIKMKQTLDFYKIYHPKDNSPIAVVNLNYMFPIHKSLLTDLKYSEIDKHRVFTDAEQKSLYIDLLRIELKEINKLSLVNAATNIYKLKYDKPEHSVSLRSFDFKKLERACLEFQQEVKM